MKETAVSTTVTSTSLDILILGWLDAKFRKSGSARTKRAYEGTLQDFRQGLLQAGIDLDSQGKEALAKIALLAQAFAGGSKRANREVKPATYNLRLAIISSFYEHAIKQTALQENPIARVERAKVRDYEKAKALDGSEVKARLVAINRDTLKGKRDYALLSLYLQTGRRLSEVAALQLQHLALHTGKITAFFDCKGDKQMADTLPPPVTSALLAWLRDYYGEDVVLGTQGDTRPVWVVLGYGGDNKHGRDAHGEMLSIQSVQDICKERLGVSNVHALRHTWAHTMSKLGAPAEVIQARLGHESLATTGRYLKQLHKAENAYADDLADYFGIE